MLNATQSRSAAGALQYFSSVLTQGDYYLGAKVGGQWRGKAALLLGLQEGQKVTAAAFKALLEGRCPQSGKRLVQRLRKDRRPGVDLTFSGPKSVSLVWAINQDERVLAAFRAAVRETMTLDVEPLVCRRLRKGAKAFTRDRQQTGNLVYADFLHQTSRPVDGVVDPHLHVHAFVMNYTADDDCVYAAEMEEVMRQLPALQARFEARLAHRLRHELGYEVAPVSFHQSGRLKTGWEIAGVDRSTIEKFSGRTAQIEEEAARRGIQDPAAKGRLGATTREKKTEGAAIETLRRLWRGRLSPQEAAAFDRLRRRAVATGAGAQSAAADARLASEALRFALEHHLYRSSTVEQHQVVATALEQAVTLAPETIEAALAREQGVIVAAHGVRGANRHYITTQTVLEAERTMIAYARNSRGTRRPIARSEYAFRRDWLNDQQKRAVLHVLGSRDAVTAVVGGAGTGKSSLMEEAADAIGACGKRLFVFAPSTGAREVLEDKGFDNAQTVEHLLRNEKLHPMLQDEVLWIDEAGLLDVRSMNGLFAIAKQYNCRVVLSGDTRQHASPRRGEAMRLLETEAGLSVVRVEAIQRQKGRYKQAIELVSRGHEVVDPKRGLTGMLAGFDLLDRMGKIKELTGEDRHEALAEEYLTVAQRGRPTLVVAPTHAEGRAATAEIRARLRAAGALGSEADEVEVTRLASLNLTEAEKGQATTYCANDSGVDSELVLQFHQNVAGGFTRGERYRVRQNDEGLPYLLPIAKSKDATPKPIPYSAADRFEVYAESMVALAAGDKIRFTLGGVSKERRRISNGRLDKIRGFDRTGGLVLASGMTVPRDYGHLDLGYVITSHAAQGKDVDIAIAAMGRDSLPAVNARQFYVTTSRGRRDLTIYVDDKQAVRRAIQQAGVELSATELVGARRQTIDQTLRRRAFLERVRDWWRANFPRREPSSTPPRAARALPPPGLSRS